MKQNIQIAALVCVVCAVCFASCKSAPKEEAAAPAETTVEPTVKDTATEEQASTDYLKGNDALLAAAETARQEAINASAQSYYAEAYNSAESQLEKIKKDCAADSKTDYSSQIKDVTARYHALAKAAQAQALKKRIDELDFSSYDKSSYDAGEAALAEFDKLGTDGDSSARLTQATKAFDSYSTVLLKSFKALAGQERKSALEAKKNADSVKAGVSKKDEYTKAADTFKKADSDYVTMNIEGAYKGYQESKTSFAELYDTVSKARAAAQEAIDKAKKAAEETKSYATEADTIAPLGEGEVQGIEAEDKKLLEDDKLANPDDAVIDVNSSTAAKAAQAETEVIEKAADAVQEAK